MNRKALRVLVAIALVVTLAVGYGCSAAAEAAKKAGVCWYQFSDTFISNARQTLLNIADADKTIAVTDADSTNDQTVQADNMSNFFTQKVNYLVLNNINMGGISQIVNQCKEKDVTTIFANTTSPSDDDFANYEKLWYVSSDSRQSGTNMGKAIADILRITPIRGIATATASWTSSSCKECLPSPIPSTVPPIALPPSKKRASRLASASAARM